MIEQHLSHTQLGDSSGINVTKREGTRAVFHIIAVSAAMLYFYFTDLVGAYVLLIIGIIATVLDFGRSRFASFQRLIPAFLLKMVRPHEKDRISAITHFILAATLLDFVYLTIGLSKDAVLLAVMFVAVGDPLARVVGRSIRYPRLFGTKKTLLGSLTFLCFGFLAAALTAHLVGAGYLWLQLCLGGLALMLLELFSGHWDNFTIPFLGSLGMAGLEKFFI